MSVAPRGPAPGASTSRRRSRPPGWGSALPLASLLGACHTPATPVAPGPAGERPSAAPAAPDAVGPSATPPPSCDGAGPLATSRPPIALADVCSGEPESGFIVLPQTRQFEGLRVACDPDGPPAANAGPFSTPLHAPAASGLVALRLLNAVAVDDVGMIHFGATYLVAEREGGVCLVDIVHEWAARPSYVETALHARWEETASGRRVWLASERLMHEPLDEAEFAAGVSDVRNDVCVRVAYEACAGRLTPIERAEGPGPCLPE